LDDIGLLINKVLVVFAFEFELSSIEKFRLRLLVEMLGGSELNLSKFVSGVIMDFFIELSLDLIDDFVFISFSSLS